ARPTGLRALEPLKMTSSRASPRNCRALDSPVTQRTASMTLDFPQPFGPTTPVRFETNESVVGSTNDLKPASLIWVSRIQSLSGLSGRNADGRCGLDAFSPSTIQSIVIHSAAAQVLHVVNPIHEFITGPVYLARGFRMLLAPGLRRYVIIPVLINVILICALITLLGWLLGH